MNIDKRLLDPADEDCVVACADLVGRSGARNFEIGYVHDDVPSEQAGWYAHAAYVGARLTVDNQPSPTAAALGLARRILNGGRCRCGRLSVVSDPATANAAAFGVTQPTTPDQCLWRLIGRTWTPSCPAPPDRKNGGTR